MTGVREEYRVETSSGGAWVSEGGHTTFATREAAERYLAERAAWYDNPVRFTHRITVRTVTPWIEVAR